MPTEVTHGALGGVNVSKIGPNRTRPHTSHDVAATWHTGPVRLTVRVECADFARMRRLSPRPTWRARRATVGLVTVLIAACERPEPVPGRKDTAIPVVPPPESTVVAPPPVSAWDSSAGPALFIVGASPGEAAVILPAYTDSASLDSTPLDAALLRAVKVDLFTGGKRAGTANITAVTSLTHSDSCTSWPVAKLLPSVADSTAFQSWGVAFQSGQAGEITLDSIEGLPSPDSSRLAADIARLASALPGDTAAVFRGLPFVVKKAWRTRGLAPQMLAAIIMRNVNQEANPRQEQIVLIAERDTTIASARYSPVYQERVTGLEETIEATDLIGMVLLGRDRRPTLIVARDSSGGSSYALLERIDGVWQLRWASAYAGC